MDGTGYRSSSDIPRNNVNGCATLVCDQRTMCVTGVGLVSRVVSAGSSAIVYGGTDVFVAGSFRACHSCFRAVGKCTVVEPTGT